MKRLLLLVGVMMCLAGCSSGSSGSSEPTQRREPNLTPEIIVVHSDVDSGVDAIEIATPIDIECEVELEIVDASNIDASTSTLEQIVNLEEPEIPLGQIVEIEEPPVPLGTNTLPETPTINKVFATLSFPSCDMREDVYYGLDTYVMDTKKAMGMFVQPHKQYRALPGDGKLTVYGKHNYLGGAKIYNAELGDELSLATGYGTFDYKVTFSGVCRRTDTNFVVDNKYLLDWDFGMKTEQVALYTCYPADAEVTSQCYVVIGELVASDLF